MVALAALVVPALLCGRARADGTYVTGSVLRNGRPVAGAQMWVDGAPWEVGAVTDDNGAYRLGPLPYGTLYFVKVYCENVAYLDVAAGMDDAAPQVTLSAEPPDYQITASSAPIDQRAEIETTVSPLDARYAGF
jgi:hypothetical protein